MYGFYNAVQKCTNLFISTFSSIFQEYSHRFLLKLCLPYTFSSRNQRGFRDKRPYRVYFYPKFTWGRFKISLRSNCKNSSWNFFALERTTDAINFGKKKRLNVNENENWLETATKDLLAMNIPVRTITSLNYSMKVLSEKRFLSHSMQLWRSLKTQGK